MKKVRKINPSKVPIKVVLLPFTDVFIFGKRTKTVSTTLYKDGGFLLSFRFIIFSEAFFDALKSSSPSKLLSFVHSFSVSF